MFVGARMDNEILYVRLLERSNQLENRAFLNLGNFLTANAFAFVAWATFYDPKKTEFGGIDLVLVLLAIAGYVGGLAWSLLGARNWEYVRRVTVELIHLGGEYRPGRDSLYRVMRGVEESIYSAWNGKWDLGSLSHYATIIAGTPLVIALLHAAMLTTLLWVRQATPFGCAPSLLASTVAAIGAVFAWIVFWRCKGSAQDSENAVKQAKEITKPKV